MSSCSFLAERARSDLTDHHARVDALAADLHDRRDQLGARRDRLRQARDLMLDRRRHLDRLRRRTEADESTVAALERKLAAQRAALVSTLDIIFPIRPGSSPLSFAILGMKPPDPSALGYIALLVDLLASYHHIPLQHALSFRGSRSLVQDRNAKWYPLFEDGVERYRAEYARFCLSKDIEQVRAEQRPRVVISQHTDCRSSQLCRLKSLEVPDIRQYLANLLNFVLAATSAPLPPPPSGKLDTNGHDAGALTAADSDDDDEEAEAGSLPSLSAASLSSDSPPRPRSPARSISSVRTITPAAEKLRAIQAA